MYWEQERSGSEGGDSTDSIRQAVEDKLLEAFDGRATLGDLKEHLGVYSMSELYSFLEEDNIFRLFKNKKQSKSLVVVYERNAKLCVQYNNRDGCQKRNCRFFHLCREYVDRSCSSRPCRLSHDIGDEYNLSITRKFDLSQYDCRDRLILVKNSIPKVCTKYNSQRGCPNSQPGSCPDIHICSDKILRRCTRGPDRCRYNHDVFACSETLSVYISMNNSEAFLEKVLLVPRNIDDPLPQRSGEKKVKTAQNTPKERKSRNHPQSDVEDDIDEKNVFEYLLKRHDGKATILAVTKGCRELICMNTDQALQWFLKQTRYRVFSHNRQQDLSVVVVVMNTLKLCFARDCQKEACRYLHVCREYLVGNCMVTGCKFNHDLRDEHNDRILTGAGLRLDMYDETNIRSLVRCSLLKCCAVYNEKNTCAEQSVGTCPDVHICSKFVKEKCRFPDSVCRYGHDLKSEECTKTLVQYRMDRLPINTAKKMILVVQKSERSASVYSQKAYICEANLRKECLKGHKCPCHHFELPYLWEMKINDQWMDLLNKNCQIEKSYCDANVSIIQMSGTTFSEGILNFDTLELTAGGQQIPVRRLSTKSYIDDSIGCHFNTCWIWYWKDGYGVWNEYSADDMPPFQDVIEGCFQKGMEQCCFERGSQKYTLRLEEGNLMQTNVVYGTQRPVRRRPLMVDDNNVKMKLVPKRPTRHYDPSELPAEWTPMDTKTPEFFEKIPIERTGQAFTATSGAFRKTMGIQYKIRKIYRIQNMTHWKSYQRKKENMTLLYKGNSSQVDEQQLFHGTDEDTIEYICRQNFDPRVHGKNAVHFGKGVYFARDATYSNSYTGQSKMKYMFHAKVLTGKKTAGDKSMKRPPPVDPKRPAGELYGSCVNDTRNPGIFVIFDRDQCYPEYLIEYEDICWSDRPQQVSGLSATTGSTHKTPSHKASKGPAPTPKVPSTVKSSAPIAVRKQTTPPSASSGTNTLFSTQLVQLYGNSSGTSASNQPVKGILASSATATKGQGSAPTYATKKEDSASAWKSTSSASTQPATASSATVTKDQASSPTFAKENQVSISAWKSTSSDDTITSPSANVTKPPGSKTNGPVTSFRNLFTVKSSETAGPTESGFLSASGQSNDNTSMSKVKKSKDCTVM